jgi:hypothetical protein
MHCPDCDTRVDPDAAACPSCGADLPDGGSDDPTVRGVARRDAVATIRSQSERDSASSQTESAEQRAESAAETRSTTGADAAEGKLMVWYPEPGLIKTPLQVGLWILVLLSISAAVGMGLVLASLLIVVVLYGGQAMVRLYSNQIEPNPRTFEDGEAFGEFVLDRETEDPDWRFSSALAVIGLILTLVGWRNIVSAVAGFFGSATAGSTSAVGGFIGFVFWFLFTGAGIAILARGCDGVVVGYLQLQRVRRFVD